MAALAVLAARDGKQAFAVREVYVTMLATETRPGDLPAGTVILELGMSAYPYGFSSEGRTSPVTLSHSSPNLVFRIRLPSSGSCGSSSSRTLLTAAL